MFDIYFIYSVIVYPILYIFPAYAANGAPVLFGGGKTPLDFGKKLKGKRIFGNNKTLRGTIAGIMCGVAAGAIESIFPQLAFMLPVAIMLSIGAIAGDLAGSFAKRRTNIKSGAKMPILDQYGFYVFALMFTFWLGNMPGLYGMIFITLLTGILHISTNIGAHLLKLKSVPW
ncbi:MAG: CDP-2,3-bis-(O-geranylgeranyl)-sn-glycerol synthase [Candidatus Marsarchaeota archaeon]|nr:CDP-2,3-bis-(O-geranylgeranyl)-sn-glycerol synthase [Candidatus Marsarchaeota archaeon]